MRGRLTPATLPAIWSGTVGREAGFAVGAFSDCETRPGANRARPQTQGRAPI